MKFSDIPEAGNMVGELRRLRAIQQEANHGLFGVGYFQDAQIVAAVLPAYAAEVSRRITEAEDRLAAMGVDMTDAKSPAQP